MARQALSVSTWPAQMCNEVCNARGIAYRIAPGLPPQLRLLTGSEIPIQGATAATPAAYAGGRAQELKHSARQRLSGAGIVLIASRYFL